MNRLKHKVLIIIVALMLFTQLIISDRYIVMKPGLSIDLAEVVRIKGGEDRAGENLMTSVSTGRASLVDLLLSLFQEGTEIAPAEEQLPPGMEIDDYMKIMERMMKESQVVSKVVALRRLGYDVEVENKVVVESLMPESPAVGKLEPGDCILSIGGKEIYSLQGAVNAIREVAPGEAIHVKFIRNGEVLEEEIRTVANISSEGEESAVLRIIISSEPVSDLPVDIEIDLDKVGGSSAGLMMCLEIIDQLSFEGINSGLAIAGTGTLDFDGRIGAISGVRQKMIAARRKGARYFLIPRGNLSDIGEPIEGLDVIGVADIDEALTVIEKIKRKN